MVLIIILGILLLIYFIKVNSNEDLIKKNLQTNEQLANIRNAEKVYKNALISKILLAISIISLVGLVIINFTDLDKMLIDYISSELYQEKEFNYYSYLFPIYVYVTREIINEVNLGDFLYNYFNVKEPTMDKINIKSLLYKKPKKK